LWTEVLVCKLGRLQPAVAPVLWLEVLVSQRIFMLKTVEKVVLSSRSIQRLMGTKTP